MPLGKHVGNGNGSGITVERRRVVHAKPDRPRRNFAGGIELGRANIDVVLDRMTQVAYDDPNGKGRKYRRDPRRITMLAYDAETGKLDVSALPENVELRDKWGLTMENNPRHLHIGYVGTLYVGDHEFTIIRMDPQIVQRGLFFPGQQKPGEEEAPVNKFLNAVRIWMRPCPDILPNAPFANDPRRYQWFIGRQGGWFIQAGLIGGRGIQQIRVVEGGIIATNGTNVLWFLSAHRIREAAMANTPLPADMGSWARIYTGNGGAIGFLTPVYELDGALHVTIGDQSKERRAVPLGALRAS